MHDSYFYGKIIKIDRKNNKQKKSFIKGRKDEKTKKKKKNNNLSPKNDKNSFSSHIKLNVVEQNNKKVMDALISHKNRKYKNEYIMTYEELEQYTKDSLDELNYEEAIISDKRIFCVMYRDILLNKHLFLNIIFEDYKYKPRTLKFITFILSIDLYFVFNGFFFNESYISELYTLDENESFFSFILRSIKRIIYTSIVSVIVNFLIDCIIVDGNKIKAVLNNNSKKRIIAQGEISDIVFKIKRSINVFYVINYFIMIISWYYISCFNNAYSNTKKEWIKSSIFIIILNNVMPIIYCFVISLLRYISIHCESERIYKLFASLY